MNAPLRTTLAASVAHPDAQPFHTHPEEGEAFTAITRDGRLIRIEEMSTPDGLMLVGAHRNHEPAEFLGWIPDEPEEDSAPLYPGDPASAWADYAEEYANDGALGRRDELDGEAA